LGIREITIITIRRSALGCKSSLSCDFFGHLLDFVPYFCDFFVYIYLFRSDESIQCNNSNI